jgi:hypothetical protein
MAKRVNPKTQLEADALDFELAWQALDQKSREKHRKDPRFNKVVEIAEKALGRKIVDVA